MTIVDQVRDAIDLALKAGIPCPYRIELGWVKTAQIKKEFEGVGLPWFCQPGSDYTVTWGGIAVDLDSATPGITVGEDKAQSIPQPKG